MKTYKYIVKKGEEKTIRIKKSGEYIIELVGENANARIVGGEKIGSGKKLIVKTIQHHKSPKTTSDLLLKTVLLDSSEVDYQGVIIIDKRAQQSNAYQRHENLLLSQNAHVTSKPELEIEADDVRCTHGATMGMIDEDQIFYLMSRGISRKKAETMIVDGFLEDVKK